MTYRTEEVVAGLWELPVEIPSAGLDVVLVYAFRVDDGLVLVDLGWGNRKSLASLEARLAEIGAALDDVRGVIFTHAHPDHYGLAGVVRERSGAWLALHPGEPIYPRGQLGRPNFLRRLVTEAGVEIHNPIDPARFAPELPVVQPNRSLPDAETIELGPWRLAATHTPGHSPGHLCFIVDGARRLVLLGDLVLARTTPNVSRWPGQDGNPLGDYLDSLRRIERVGAGALGLPGHEEKIVDIPARIAEILAHHDQQFADVTVIVGSGHETVGAVAERMRWSRPWEQLGYIGRVLAMGEAHAHLQALVVRGDLSAIDGPPRRFACV